MEKENMKEKKELYRDTEKGKLAGICAGVAEHFGLEVWLVRILTITGFFLAAGTFFFVAYIAAWFILDKKPTTTDVDANIVSSSGKGWTNSQAQKVEVKSKVWQAGEPPRKAFYDISSQYRNMENRLQNLETYVTSKTFQIDRELSRL
jgi:phage shock protein C